MTALYLPGALFRPISYRKEAGVFAAPPIGWILHTTVMNGSPYNVFAKAVSPNRRFSHAWVARDGSAEQYQTLDYKSWAQANGNGAYWSIETEGFPNEPLTDAQIATLAEFHRFLGVANKQANTPGEPGIGTHYMGGAAWGGHTCPDSKPGIGPRSHQRFDILVAVSGQAGGKSAAAPVNATDKAAINAAFGTPTPAPAPAPAPKPAPAPVKHVNAVTGPFPLPSGQWFGVDDHTSKTHSGVRGGADHTHVAQIQREVGAVADGDYGSATAAKVAAWQKAHHLGADGAVGPVTWLAMTKA